jgi:hypothetical protein
MDISRLHASGALSGPHGPRRHFRLIDIWAIGMVGSGVALLLCLWFL